MSGTAQEVQEGESLILEEEIDPNYEPSEQDIRDYATFLGMDLDNDQDLFWLAKEGLKDPLPADWKPCQTKQGEIYYFNFATGESQWEHPIDNIYKEKYQKEKEAKEGVNKLMERLAVYDDRED